VSLDLFHPVVSGWFRDTLGEPTAAQRLGWAAIRQRQNTLIAAPTGSGKTLAAFLSAIDDLFVEGLEAPLPDEVRIVYVSPLKALSADIHRNLAEPRHGIRQAARALGLRAPRITAAVRTGDTSPAERAAMLRTPPHILVTTPESLYLLLTAERSRGMLARVRTVIVDEIHAVIGSRRGAHLALSLERLERVTGERLVRLGLSATQRPIETVARFLVGSQAAAADPIDCAIVDHGHRREMDLAIETPRSPLEAVLSNEVWEEYYDRLAALVREHRTTLVFVNTRRLAERIARHLSERLGEDAVTAHHGSLSKERRLDAEERLRTGRLNALVATASLELGIDVGFVDLVCQIGSPRWIATFLQRAGRSGHTVHGRPKGRLFPTSRDDLLECAALLRAVRLGELDRLASCEAPLDVLAQQIVAESACGDSPESDLYDLARRAYPYRDLDRADFDRVVEMVASGFTTRRGRRGALVHRDEVNGRIRGRRGSRLTAITAGGAIPDNADYRVVLDGDETFIGTLNEDFAIESAAGDVFQLGNTSWRIVQVASGTVRVEDARGAPPTIPFWLGEAPGRSSELSAVVGDLRGEIERRLPDRVSEAATWLEREVGLSAEAAEQIVAYLADAHRLLGVLPTQQTIVLERFFDESGGMQLVLHAPFGSRVNRAWGLALRKRFCRQFNFELQAAATEEGLLLSLGPQHSFPLADVFRYLHPASVRDVLVQAFLDAPVFQTRWRWNASISLAVLRNRGGRRVPPQIQRMQADDLLAAAFPDAAACLENIPGDRQIPDHPLVQQTVRDCLEEAMDLPRLTSILARIHDGGIACVARDVPEPSPLSHEILNARPYAFLDDAPLEERRAHAVYARRASEPSRAADLGALDAAAIARVREEAWPEARDADELHDALLTAGFVIDAEGRDAAGGSWLALFDELLRAKRATRVTRRGLAGVRPLWVAAERLPEIAAVAGGLVLAPEIAAPSRRSAAWTGERAMIELLRSRLSVLGPVTAEALAEPLGADLASIDAALLALEAEGVVMRGAFTPSDRPAREWCDRRLLARVHRYTLGRLRAEIEPVPQTDLVRFLFAWQHLDHAHRLTGTDGLRTVLAQLDGFEAPAVAWERDILPARVDRYEPSMLDALCLGGEAAWGRLTAAARSGGAARPFRATPVALFRRQHAAIWRALTPGQSEEILSAPARRVHGALERRGASFFQELSADGALTARELEPVLAELVVAGLVSSDSFAGLRAMLRARTERPGFEPAARESGRGAGMEGAGRWSLIAVGPAPAVRADEAVELQARVLLDRYGVVCRGLLDGETGTSSWRELVRVYRRLEARGEIRGGRFVTGFSGEQFALPDAVATLREVRRTPPGGRLIAIGAADPLNLTGRAGCTERVAATAANRIVYRDGVALAAMEGDYVRRLADYDPADAGAVARALAGRPVPAVMAGFLGRVG
jgi:ATP-dependent Lhr-like helicase